MEKQIRIKTVTLQKIKELKLGLKNGKKIQESKITKIKKL